MAEADTLLEVRDLKVHFPIERGIILKRRVGSVRAVDGVSFRVRRGEALGLVGESGCGKSTTAMAIAQLQPATSGEVLFEGRTLGSLPPARLREARMGFQIIFQDPYSSLDPRMRAADIVAEPLRIYARRGIIDATTETITERTLSLMERCGLPASFAGRYPHEFSGGQRQRIGIARALALGPKLILADEPVSALDVSIQSQILNLLKDLQKELGLTFLLIAHDLAVIEYFCDRIAVMYLGRIVETAGAASLNRSPLHPYTRALLSAVPVPDPAKGARAQAHHPERGRAFAVGRACGLSLPRAVPRGDAAMRDGDADPSRGRGGARGRLPSLRRIMMKVTIRSMEPRDIGECARIACDSEIGERYGFVAATMEANLSRAMAIAGPELVVAEVAEPRARLRVGRAARRVLDGAIPQADRGAARRARPRRRRRPARRVRAAHRPGGARLLPSRLRLQRGRHRLLREARLQAARRASRFCGPRDRGNPDGEAPCGRPESRRRTCKLIRSDQSGPGTPSLPYILVTEFRQSHRIVLTHPARRSSTSTASVLRAGRRSGPRDTRAGREVGGARGGRVPTFIFKV